jgi:hypothetical protein
MLRGRFPPCAMRDATVKLVELARRLAEMAEKHPPNPSRRDEAQCGARLEVPAKLKREGPRAGSER